MRKFLAVFAVLCLLLVFSVPVFAASLTGQYTYIDAAGVSSVRDISYSTRVGNVDVATVNVPVSPGNVLRFPDGWPITGNSTIMGYCGIFDSNNTKILSVPDVGTRWVVPDDYADEYVTIKWYEPSADGPLIRFTLSVLSGEDFITAVGTVSPFLYGWLGAFFASLFTGSLSPLLPLMVVSVIVSVILLGIYLFKRSGWGS